MARRWAVWWVALAVLAVAVAVVVTAAVPAQCPSSLPASTMIASFDTSAQFSARQNNLGGAASDNGTMTTFSYNSTGRFVTVKPSNANSVWFVTVPASSASAVPIRDTAGAVVAFELGPGDPARFSVQLVVQASSSNTTSATAFKVPVQLYATTGAPTDGVTWQTVRVPLQHFGIPTRLPFLAAIQFVSFPSPYGAGATPVRFDNIRLEFNPCPVKMTLLPPQTCAPSTLVVDDFSSATRFASNKNALGGRSSSSKMTSVTYLSASNPLGPGVQLMATRNDSYWTTNLVSSSGAACIVAWPYTTLQVRLSASLGASLVIELRRSSDDCASKLVNYITIDSSYYANFTGVTDFQTINIPLDRLVRDPYATVAISGFYRTTGAPTDGQGNITVVVKSIAFLRDCARVASLPTTVVPPVIDWCGPSDTNVVALSFDGPADYTEAILDYFLAEGIKATFFHQPGLIIDRIFDDPADYDEYGYTLQPGPDSENCRIVRRVVNEGHTLGDHTYTHPRYVYAHIPSHSIFSFHCRYIDI